MRDRRKSEISVRHTPCSISDAMKASLILEAWKAHMVIVLHWAGLSPWSMSVVRIMPCTYYFHIILAINQFLEIFSVVGLLQRNFFSLSNDFMDYLSRMVICGAQGVVGICA